MAPYYRDTDSTQWRGWYVQCPRQGINTRPFLLSGGEHRAVGFSLNSFNEGQAIKVRVSHYWPPLGGTNCALFVAGECVSSLASGERWQDWIGRAVACPPEWEFGTRLLIGNKEWLCLDRGSKIFVENGIPWVDMLIEDALFPYGTIVEAKILPP